jgi:hypothetical protein
MGHMRWTLMRCIPVRCQSVRYIPMECTPMACTPARYAPVSTCLSDARLKLLPRYFPKVYLKLVLIVHDKPHGWRGVGWHVVGVLWWARMVPTFSCTVHLVRLLAELSKSHVLADFGIDYGVQRAITVTRFAILDFHRGSEWRTLAIERGGQCIGNPLPNQSTPCLMGYAIYPAV